ncbi:Ribosomal protein [Actinidia chinensis var. chinensis]|uniref:Ribosomal protein n=1 Tax=Actinidia chinensis var. chinensis TaxID=1590841 RepID=A0A2R6R267_ACTCC|nr:uncharacterized protein LOC130785645 isoform X2 [Actinidia eriantha]PSS19325.1 Ribosomal protein [Actinidia chinensis var. chinensis]
MRSSKLGMLCLSKYQGLRAGLLASRQVIPDICPSYHATDVLSKFSIGSRYLSSQSGAESRNIYKGFHLPPSARKVGLPKSRVLYTVLRSPHIDKKSREQFALETKKELVVIKTEIDQLRKMSFWLKRLRIIGAQYEMLFSCKTHLDKEKVQRLLQNDALPNMALARKRAQPDASKKKAEASIRMRISYF